MRNASKRARQNGAVLVEFSLILPMMLLFFFGLIEIGRMFSQVSWFARVNYEAALAGSQAPAMADKVNAAVNEAFVGMLWFYQQDGYVKISETPVLDNAGAHANVDSRTVNVAASAVVQPMLKQIGFTLPVRFSGSMLGQGGTPIGSYSSFANPAVLYNCAGAPGSSDSAPCSNLRE